MDGAPSPQKGGSLNLGLGQFLQPDKEVFVTYDIFKVDTAGRCSIGMRSTPSASRSLHPRGLALSRFILQCKLQCLRR